MLGAIRFLLIYAVREGFRGGPLLDVYGFLQLLNSSHVMLRSIMVGGVWNGLLLGRVRSQAIPCRFCGAPDGDGHLFWECTFPPLVEIRENPECHDLGSMVPPLGQLVRLRVLVTLLRLRLVVTLLV